MNRKTETRTISQFFLSALINGDDSGMGDNEIKQLDDWLNKNNYGRALCPDNFETDFRRCEITGLYSNCVDVDFYLRGQ